MNEQKSKHPKPTDEHRKKPNRDDGIVEESTEGDGGPTGSGGVASQSPSPGDEPRKHRKDR
jgi:hypothetical protein